MGIEVPGVPALQPYSASSVADLSGRLTDASGCDDDSGIFNTGSAVVQALIEAIPILAGLECDLGFLDLGACAGRSPLTTKSVFPSYFCETRSRRSGFSFMDYAWQYNNPPNPADAAMGPQAYDHHLYYRFAQVFLGITAV
jgi:hypothetical protein